MRRWITRNTDDSQNTHPIANKGGQRGGLGCQSRRPCSRCAASRRVERDGGRDADSGEPSSKGMIIEEAERIVAERNILITRHEITFDAIYSIFTRANSA
jgi:hypothetical protein